jgi:formate/nitrite transporter FocA (FNT family)
VRILDEEIHIEANLKASFRLYWYLWLALFLTAFLDFGTTLLFMYEDGIQQEGNYIVRLLAYTFGIVPGVLLGKSLQIVAAVGFSALSLRMSRPILLLILLINFLAVIINLYGPNLTQ